MVLLFESVHFGIYIYDSVCYKNNKTKIKIKCRQHGIFYQTAYNHSKGHGCAKCDYSKRKFNQNDVILKFKIIHNDFYDYSLTVYKGMSKKITIKCPIHGLFEQKAQNHYNGCGCLKCYKENRSINVRNDLN